MKKEYLTYELEDLLENKDFVAWVKPLSENEIRNQLSIGDNENITKIMLAKNILTAVTSKQDYSLEKAQIWKNIALNTKSNQQFSKKTKTFYLRIAAIAAVFILGLFVFTGIMNQDVNVHNPYAQITDHALPDGSTVILNANSDISYDKKFNSNRSLYLKGEAFFEVMKGSRFLVNTDLGQVEVLGTSFNVYSRDNELTVICKTGKVRVASLDGSKETVLMPGQKVSFTNNDWQEALDDQEITWKSQKQLFDKSKISNVSKSLEAFYGKSIKIDPGIDTLLFSGQISLENLEKSIDELTWPLRLKYKIVDDTIYIGKF